MMRGTIWITPKLDEPEIPLPVPQLKIIKSLPVTSGLEFEQRVREEYPSPDVDVEFGPIGVPWV